ncbi:MAG: hypothetical protein ACKVKF_06950 [Rhodobacterales bacterium]|nr:hypothetical protein [Puniceibacterium antarcticum]
MLGESGAGKSMTGMAMTGMAMLGLMERAGRSPGGSIHLSGAPDCRAGRPRHAEVRG